MDSPGGSDFKEVTEANFNKLSTALTKIGYKDGIVDGRESVFQLGFDVGYADGLKTAFLIAKWKAIRNLLKNELNAQSTHPILDAEDKEHHKILTNREKPIDEISNLQSEYYERIRNSLNEDFKGIKHILE